MKKILFILLIVGLFSCVKQAQESTANGEFVVELLFTHDSCNVYRFKDGGRLIYWSNCNGNIHYNYSTSGGKAHTTHHVETLNNSK